MKLIANVGAMDYLMTLQMNGMISWDIISDMVRKITDKHLEVCFDNYIIQEFPDGIDEYEFIAFCTNYQGDIYTELGLEPMNEQDED